MQISHGRRMARVELGTGTGGGALLDGARRAGGERPLLRLAWRTTLLGRAKYALLEHQRRRAQIKARRLLDLADRADDGSF